jgi:hypothetical protein
MSHLLECAENFLFAQELPFQADNLLCLWKHPAK